MWGGVAGLIAVLGAMLLIGGVTAGNWLSIAIAVLMIGFGINRFGYIRQH